MMWRKGIVESLGRTWEGSRECQVRLSDDENVENTGVRSYRALAYVPLVGEPCVGDVVLLSGASVAKNLGTGGYMMIVGIPERLPADSLGEAGHIVKARYTPLQYMTLGVDEQDSPHHSVLEKVDSIDGLPVLVADLHSALVPVLAAVRARKPEARIVYVMSDGAALPLWFSRSVAELKGAGWLAASITAGQAFGGDFEAVNIHTALLAARHVCGADAVIVSQGPGNLGTGTKWGFSGTQVGDVINAVNALNGRAIGVLRMSDGDKRERHFGLSHHSLTALTQVALSPVTCPVPVFDESDDLSVAVSERARAILPAQLDELFACKRLTRQDVSTEGLTSILRNTPFTLSTMGRGLDEDPLAFLSAAVAGYALAEVC